MEKNIVIGVKKPGEQVEFVNTTGELKELQNIVGGYVETFPFKNGIRCWCNEEGKIHNLPPNFYFCGDCIVGTVFFSRDDDCDIASLTSDDCAYLKLIFA